MGGCSGVGFEGEGAFMINLTEFCEDLPWWNCDSSRPFVFSGYRHATDARICIRVPAIGEFDTSPGNRPFPPCEMRFQDFPTIADWTRWPAPNQEDEHAICAVCAGTGGMGSIVCEHCSGEGRWLERKQLIGSKFIDVRYDQKIRALPNAHFSSPADEPAIYFRFDGGEGVVMPLRQPS